MNKWKGNIAKHSAVHQWIRTHFGKAYKCENKFCDKTSTKYEWANIKEHINTRNIKCYKMMCRKCHSILDKSKYCKNGHKRTNKNTYIYPNGIRRCMICNLINQRNRRSNGKR